MADVIISAILVKTSIKLSAIIQQVNDKTRDLFNTYRFHFISNNEIVRDLLLVIVVMGLI